MATRQDERNTINLVYKASLAGSVSTLNELIMTNPLILRKFSLTSFTETPLHVSALLGHHDFTRALLTHNPHLAKELDSFHLASAEGHEEIVQALLHPDHVEMCLVHDQDGRIPLHYAAMRGRLEVLMKLLRAKLESIFVPVLNRSRETVLHLCVKYNQLECLKLLVEYVGDDQRSEFLNSKEGVGGQTILHLALGLKQTETIRYLLSIPIVQEESYDVIASYVLENNSEDFRNLQLQQIVVGNNDERYQHSLSAVRPGTTINVLHHNNTVENVSKARWWSKLMKYFQYPTDWLEETRGMLIVVAGMIATMTFQAAANPPGGIWQQDNWNSKNRDGRPICTESHICAAGTAVLAHGDTYTAYRFHKFLYMNTLSFVASLSVTFLLISGFPLHNRLCVWLLSLGMCIVLTCMATAYVSILLMMIPSDRTYDEFYTTSQIASWIWTSLLGMVFLIHTLRLLIWLVKWLRRRLRQCNMNL